MQQENEFTTVVMYESSRCLVANALDSDTAITLLALVSEDPSNWEEAMSVWPRYRSPVVCEFASSLPIEETGRQATRKALLAAEAWVVINFETKQIFTGGQFQEIDRDAAFAMVVDEQGNQHCPLSVHLPPWWELHHGVAVGEVNQPRQSPINRPNVNRDVLYGNAFLAEISAKILETAESQAWRQSEASVNKQDRYPFTVAVHRDWLMTPRADLNGRTPRELLHGATGWSDRVTWGQRLRFEDGGPMVAVPNDWDGFVTGPMGSEEMYIYFDLCREVIGAGWFWCESDEGKQARHKNESPQLQLTQFLRTVKDDWLRSPFEGGSPPSFIIECDRQRVPRGAGVAIEGIDGVQSEEHVADCDCPICEMMADGVFGVGFTSIDGHHLELDEEFAFSMHETREAWEKEQREYADSSAALDREQAERKASATDDPFASAWSGILDDGPIPGDRGGYLKMAFMVGEIVSELQRLDANHDEIKKLNDAFANYRRTDGSPQSASKLKETLQTLSDRHCDLVSKSADLQSRIDAAARVETRGDSDLDVPF